MSLGLGGIGERRPLSSVPRSAAPSNARSASFTEAPRVLSYGNGSNSNAPKPPTVEALRVRQAAASQANTVVGSRTLSGSLGGVAPSVTQMPRPVPALAANGRKTTVQPRALHDSNSSATGLGHRSSSDSAPLRANVSSYGVRRTATPEPERREPEPPHEDDVEEFEEEDVAPPPRSRSSERRPAPVASAALPAESSSDGEDTVRFLASALLEMKEALSRMQQHMSDQNKKWSETEQKLKYEIGELAKVKDNFASQMSSLKTDLRTLKEDIGGVGVTEKFDQIESQIGDLKDRTNQFLGTTVRDVWAYLSPPVDLFSVDKVGASETSSGKEDTEFIAAGTQVVLMPPVTAMEETGLWIRARLITRHAGDQKIFWVPLDAAPQVLPPSAFGPKDDPNQTKFLECVANFQLFGAPAIPGRSAETTVSADYDSQPDEVEIYIPNLKS